MSETLCPMCDKNEPNGMNPHGWCDQCEAEFCGVLERIAHQCASCVTVETCMMRNHCNLNRSDSERNSVSRTRAEWRDNRSTRNARAGNEARDERESRSVRAEPDDSASGEDTQRAGFQGEGAR